jgi:hypothetical protein
MRAKQGDWIRVGSHKLGVPERRGEIVAVHGEDGAPPFEVRWLDSGHVTVFLPGSDAVVEHHDDQVAAS